MSIENIMLNKGNQAQKRPYIVWFHFYEMCRMNKSVKTESRLVVVWGQEGEGEGGERSLNGNKECLLMAM